MNLPSQSEFRKVASLHDGVRERLEKHLFEDLTAQNTTEIIDLSSELRQVSELNRALAHRILTAAKNRFDGS